MLHECKSVPGHTFLVWRSRNSYMSRDRAPALSMMSLLALGVLFAIGVLSPRSWQERARPEPLNLAAAQRARTERLASIRRPVVEEKQTADAHAVAEVRNPQSAIDN